MNGRNAIVISIDGLRASALGAYGNTWYGTPALDALASQSVVVDWMYGESSRLGEYHAAVWQDGALLGQLAALGVAISLVTDDEHVASWAASAGVSDILCIEGERESSARDVAETALAALTAVAAERLQMLTQANVSAGWLLWVHARGFQGPWDAPHDMRSQLLDEDDPAAPDFVLPPARETVRDHDAALGYRAAYAAQAIVLDECLGGLLAAIDATGPAAESLVALVGCRGFSLGEHGVVGAAADSLYSEVLHVPCLVRAPHLAPAPPRCNVLSTPRDVHATLATWFQVPPNGRSLAGADLLADFAPRQFVRAANERGDRALRTSAWTLIRTAVDDETGAPRVELFVQPDDRWEANEVADRCRSIVERLLAVLDAGAGDNNGGSAAPLDDDLVQGAN